MGKERKNLWWLVREEIPVIDPNEFLQFGLRLLHPCREYFFLLCFTFSFGQKKI
jgi:hypothetical protein